MRQGSRGMCLPGPACLGLCLRSGHTGLNFGIKPTETSFNLGSSLSLDVPRGRGASTAKQEPAPWGRVTFCSSDLDIDRSAWVQLPGSHSGGDGLETRERRGLGKSHNLMFQEEGLADVLIAQGLSKSEARLERVNEAVLGVLQGPGRYSMLRISR